MAPHRAAADPHGACVRRGSAVHALRRLKQMSADEAPRGSAHGQVSPPAGSAMGWPVLCWPEEQRHRGAGPRLSAELSHVRRCVGKLGLVSLAVNGLTTGLASLRRSYSERLYFNFKHRLTLNSLPRILPAPKLWLSCCLGAWGEACAPSRGREGKPPNQAPGQESCQGFTRASLHSSLHCLLFPQEKPSCCLIEFSTSTRSGNRPHP